MSTAEDTYDTEEAMRAELSGRTAPMPTRVLAEKVARRMPGKSVDEIASILIRIAKRGDRHATHNGRTVMRFGRQMTGYLWHDRSQIEGSVLPKPDALPVPEAGVRVPHPTRPGMLIEGLGGGRSIIRSEAELHLDYREDD